jgi:hypothetical protein
MTYLIPSSDTTFLPTDLKIYTRIWYPGRSVFLHYLHQLAVILIVVAEMEEAFDDGKCYQVNDSPISNCKTTEIYSSNAGSASGGTNVTLNDQNQQPLPAGSTIGSGIGQLPSYKQGFGEYVFMYLLSWGRRDLVKVKFSMLAREFSRDRLYKAIVVYTVCIPCLRIPARTSYGVALMRCLLALHVPCLRCPAHYPQISRAYILWRNPSALSAIACTPSALRIVLPCLSLCPLPYLSSLYLPNAVSIAVPVAAYV